MDNYEIKTKATERIRNTPKLLPYRNILLNDKWRYCTWHFKWILSEEIDAIVAWCKVEKENYYMEAE